MRARFFRTLLAFVVLAGIVVGAGSTNSYVLAHVAKAPTRITVSASLKSSVYGEPVTFNAAVTQGGAYIGGASVSVVAALTANVQWFDTYSTMRREIGTSKLSLRKNGAGARMLAATVKVNMLAVGIHTITAVYSGNTRFKRSSSRALTFTVRPIPTTTTLSSLANPSVYGQSVTFNAAVTQTSAYQGGYVGTLQLFDSGVSVAVSDVNGDGKAEMSINTLGVGAHTLTAEYTYTGSTNVLAGSLSMPLTQTVNKADTTTVATKSVTTTPGGSSVIFTVTVTVNAPGAGTPTGAVTFLDGNTYLGSTTVNAGTVSFKTSSSAAAKHAITVAYSGDTNFNSSSTIK